MMRNFTITLALAALSALGSVRADPPASAAATRDRAVILAALEDFAKWKGATFGVEDGVLAFDEGALFDLELSTGALHQVTPRIRVKLPHDLVSSWRKRNRNERPAADLVSGSPWVKPKPKDLDVLARPQLPDGIKAIGSFTLPGFSKSGSMALLQVHHSWSIHGAIVTYVLARESGQWRVVAREQTVYL